MLDTLVKNGIEILGGLAILEAVISLFLIIRMRKIKKQLDIAATAAEDAARAAALAAPGGIDPEVVIGLLRAGQPTTLDNVYAIMEQQAKAEAE
jgi:uncharacterized membrane protein